MPGSLLRIVFGVAATGAARLLLAEGVNAALGMLWSDKLSVVLGNMGFAIPRSSLAEMVAEGMIEATVERALRERAGTPAGVWYAVARHPSGLIYANTAPVIAQQFPLNLPARTVIPPDQLQLPRAARPDVRLLDPAAIVAALTRFEHLNAFLHDAGLDRAVQPYRSPRPPKMRPIKPHLDCDKCRWFARVGVLRQWRCTANAVDDTGNLIGLPCVG